MPKDTLNEREFELINIIGAEISPNQRDLSRQMELSLGMTNMLIRRLIAKGLIRIKQLNKKKVEYILTPKGFAEKMRKSVKYTLKTINSIGLIQEKLRTILLELAETEAKNFYVIGESDLVVLVERIFQDHLSETHKLQRVTTLTDKTMDGLVLVCQEKFDMSSLNGHRCVNLIQELAKANSFVTS